MMDKSKYNKTNQLTCELTKFPNKRVVASEIYYIINSILTNHLKQLDFSNTRHSD